MVRRLAILAFAAPLLLLACGDDKPNTPPVGDIGTDAIIKDGEATDTTPPKDVNTTPDPGPDLSQPDVAPDVPQDTGPADTFVPPICLLNNCTSDAHCTGCTENRTTCKLSENRCVACDPETQTGCAEGEVCTGFGICADPQKQCPTDPATGEPTITCQNNADCAACSPMNQVCDASDGKCKACTTTNLSHCLQSQYCSEGKCTAKCPKACLADNDCDFCGTTEQPAKACFAHKCAECSDTYHCAQGMVCDKGVCIPWCGKPDTEGACTDDSDCIWCGDNKGQPDNPDAWTCKFPINGATYGKCGPKATGCSDIGDVAVLPEPWSQVTNLCSDDMDCSGIGIEYNVGGLIKKLVGGDELDLGFTTVPISDANVFYGMNSCASFNITDNIDCGVCVPCKVDADCAPLPVDGFMSDLFQDSTLAQIAAAFLLDKLYGDQQEKNLNFFCQPVAAGFGVCAPCGNPLQACGETGGGTTTECPADAHNVCESGVALAPACGDCATAVCESDSYCCDSEWDSTCVSEVDQYCTTSCGGGTTTTCHNACTEGDAQEPACGDCAAAICDADGYCCDQNEGAWDSYCVDAASAEPLCADQCAAPTGCLHSECEAGPALESTCSDCATAVCGEDSWCCTNEWDAVCINKAQANAACSCPAQ